MPRGAKPKQYSSDLVSRVADLYASGKTQAEVAQAVGLSQKVVWNVMRRAGISARVAAKRNQMGDANHLWKGDDAGKQALHRRLYARFGKPRACQICGTSDPAKAYDYANLTGRYEDLNDYMQMCRSCHWRYDMKILNIKHMRRDADG
jgi:DNA-binding transcriptional regulator LsrR (DeoR family)